jgi:hypothetical protein
MRNRKDKLSGTLPIVNSCPPLYHEPWSLSISTLGPFTNFIRSVSRFRVYSSLSDSTDFGNYRLRAKIRNLTWATWYHNEEKNNLRVGVMRHVTSDYGQLQWLIYHTSIVLDFYVHRAMAANSSWVVVTSGSGQYLTLSVSSTAAARHKKKNLETIPSKISFVVSAGLLIYVVRSTILKKQDEGRGMCLSVSE